MKNFNRWMEVHQTEWRNGRVSTEAYGMHSGSARPWIVPPDNWEDGLWLGLRVGTPNSLSDYLAKENIQKHVDAHNLKSSWVACANLYFPFRETPEDLDLIASFLRNTVSVKIQNVDQVELEYAEQGALHPSNLLGETGGGRGAGQTSPDIAFLVNGGTGIVVTESKLAEHSFYRCSARTRKDSVARPANPNPARCLNAKAVLADPESQCHQVEWGRKYWECLRGALEEEKVCGLKACPAAFAGYQLFRQQALAEGYTQKYGLVFSAVAYDERNDTLVNSMNATGITHFPAEWGALFRGKSRFAAWTHQSWVNWVRRHQTGRWNEWLEWIEARYGYQSAILPQRDDVEHNAVG